jgi:hypothetical protein
MEQRDINHRSEFDPTPRYTEVYLSSNWVWGSIPTCNLCRSLNSISCVVIEGG